MQCGCTEQRDDSHPGGIEREGSRFHHAAQNGASFKMNE